MKCLRCGNTNFSKHCRLSTISNRVWLCGDCCRANLDKLREWKIWEHGDDTWLSMHNATYWSRDMWLDQDGRFERLMSLSLLCPQCGEKHL
jgi:hypothetical protein